MLGEQLVCGKCNQEFKFLKIMKINGEGNSNIKDIYCCPHCNEKLADNIEEANLLMGVN